MTLTKPAMMSAFVCPGLGQWVTGRRLLGGLMIALAVVALFAPLSVFLYSLVSAPECDPFEHGVLGCTGKAVVFAWTVADGPLGLGLLAFGFDWVAAVLHANRLEIPARP